MGKPESEIPVATKKLVSECMKTNKKAERERDRLLKEHQKEIERQKKLDEKERLREERQSKKDAEEKDKEEKRLKRIEEQRKKDEEKELERKKKEDEKKKKDEERIQKENEKKKEEEFKQKRDEKQRAVLLGFLVKGETKKEVIPSLPITDGPFMQFQLRKDMKIAPSHRVSSSHLEEKRANLDRLFLGPPSDSTDLTASLGLTKFGRTDYLHELQTHQHQPLSSSSTWPTEPPDVQFLGDGISLPMQRDLLRKPGTGGSGGTVWLRAKLFQFVENYRPAYYGTWRRRSYLVTGRRPCVKDMVELDYTVDSDDEWEEEEPGESITQSDNEEDEEEEGKEEDEEEDDDDHFFVPHGYLSDDEGVSAEDNTDADEAGHSEELKKLRRRLSCIEYEAAHTRGLQRLKRFLWGPVWSYANGCPPTGADDPSLSSTECALPVGRDEDKENVEFCCYVNSSAVDKNASSGEVDAKPDAHTIRDPLGVYRVHLWNNNLPIPVSLDVVEPPKATPRRAKKTIPDEATAHFILLVHKSSLGKLKLAFEFRVFWHRHTTGRLPECTSYIQFKRYMASNNTSQTTPVSTAVNTPPSKPTRLSQSMLWDGLALSQTLLAAKLNEIAVFEDGRWSVHPDVLRRFSSRLSLLLENNNQCMDDLDDIALSAITFPAWNYLSNVAELTRNTRRQSASKKQLPEVAVPPEDQQPEPSGFSTCPTASPSVAATAICVPVKTPTTDKAKPKPRRSRSSATPTTPDASIQCRNESPSVTVVEKIIQAPSNGVPPESTVAINSSGGAAAKRRITLENFFASPSPKRKNKRIHSSPMPTSSDVCVVISDED